MPAARDAAATTWDTFKTERYTKITSALAKLRLKPTRKNECRGASSLGPLSLQPRYAGLAVLAKENVTISYTFERASTAPAYPVVSTRHH
jgi:hypothetical protein